MYFFVSKFLKYSTTTLSPLFVFHCISIAFLKTYVNTLRKRADLSVGYCYEVPIFQQINIDKMTILLIGGKLINRGVILYEYSYII